MKIFIFCIGNPTPIFETELELIRTHEKSGDTVRVFQCTGSLTNCHWNHQHISSVCAKCRSKFKNGWKILNPDCNVQLKELSADRTGFFDIPPVFSSVNEIKSYMYDDENIGRGVASSLVSIFRDHRFDTHKFRDDVTRELTTAEEVYISLKREFEEFKPDRVYIFNGRITTQLPAVLLCERLSIEYFCYEVAFTSNSYLLRRNSTSHSIPAMREEIDMLWSAGGSDREKTARLFFQQRRDGIDEVKMSSFTKYQVKSLLPHCFNKEKKNIAIFNSTIDEYTAFDGWENPLYEPDETAGIRSILESFEDDDRYLFYLRVHPHMKEVPSTTSQLLDIQELCSKFRNLYVIWPADVVDSYALMDACEKIITFGSTIGIEAAYWGKPSILTGRALYENLDCVYVPKSHEELVGLLKKDLAPLPADSSLKYGYREMSHGIPFKYFKQTGMDGSFDGVVIKPSLYIRIYFLLLNPQMLFDLILQRIKMVLLKTGVSTSLGDNN